MLWSIPRNNCAQRAEDITSKDPCSAHHIRSRQWYQSLEQCCRRGVVATECISCQGGCAVQRGVIVAHAPNDDLIADVALMKS